MQNLLFKKGVFIYKKKNKRLFTVIITILLQ